MIVTPVPMQMPHYRLWLTYVALFVLGVLVGAVGACLLLRAIVERLASQIGG